MNTFVLLPLQETMAQRDGGKDDQLRGYMTVLVANHGIIKFFSILTAVICPMIKFDVDQSLDYFRQQEKRMLAIRYQLSTLSTVHVDQVHHLPHILQLENGTYCLPKGNQ
jgi:hypothetical protein